MANIRYSKVDFVILDLPVKHVNAKQSNLFTSASVTSKKSWIILTLRVNVIKLFFSITEREAK